MQVAMESGIINPGIQLYISQYTKQLSTKKGIEVIVIASTGIWQPTRINQHECYLLVEDCVQELFLIKPVCEVEAREGERKAEHC